MSYVEEPIVRAVVASGEVWDDPSDDLLFILLGDVEDDREEFVIVERTADESGQTYMQVSRVPEGLYQLEYRNGGPDRHFEAFTSDKRLAHEVLAGWTYDLPGWGEAVVWKPWQQA